MYSPKAAKYNWRNSITCAASRDQMVSTCTTSPSPLQPGTVKLLFEIKQSVHLILALTLRNWLSLSFRSFSYPVLSSGDRGAKLKAINLNHKTFIPTADDVISRQV